MDRDLSHKSVVLRKLALIRHWQANTLSLPRRLLLANGLAILAVVAHHSAGWGSVAMFWWADSYRAVDAVPDLSALGSSAYYVLVAVNVLTRFSIPTFVFISGFFMAYAVRGTDTFRRNWRVVGPRLIWIVVPYIIWSTVAFAVRWLEGCTAGCRPEPIGSYARDLVLGTALPAYWYIPLLLVMMLLSPLVSRAAQRHWQPLLVSTALLLVGVRLLPYLNLAIPALLVDDWAQQLRSLAVLLFYFALGLVYRTHMEGIKPRLARIQPYLPLMITVGAVLSILDMERTSRIGLAELPPTIEYASIFIDVYALGIILAVLVNERLLVPGTRLINALGSAAFGIYLLHPLLLEYLARGVHRFSPWLMAYPMAFLLLLVVGSVGLPLLFMSGIRSSPAKRFYRHLFG